MRISRVFSMGYLPHILLQHEKTFWCKRIREWLDDKEWTMKFTNWDTYYFYQKKEIKRALHQSASVLFLRVWEESGAIFIDYLINIPSIPFMKKLAVFDCK